ncbi:uncharacterized protein M6B38_273920 [Iris pallida]|uniref:FLZ-type domain-containing protein n=1 Tax=Iris pallida TaxID=29817 RepID=A0AAX6I555_IRIPA|nr:uncharacterized protein M6B38_273920 [Iris pallida]
MAGLGVLLESQQKSFPKCPQIISKATLFIKKSSTTTTTTTTTLPPSPLHPTFLDHCYLCRQRLLDGKDIYMYRGDRAFCSEECRFRQIFMDEEGAATDNCSLAAASAACGRGGKSRAVGGGGGHYFS